MASIVQIPFNNNPASTTIKVASYTIPAGKYAFATPYFTAAGSTTAATYTHNSCTINGTSVFWEDFKVTRTVSASTAALTFTIPTTAMGSGTWAGYVSDAVGSAQTAVSSFNGTIFQAFSVPSGGSGYFGPHNLKIGGGEVLSSVTSPALSSNKFFFFNFVSDKKPIETWVPAGTILSGTGSFAWMVREYNSPS